MKKLVIALFILTGCGSLSNTDNDKINSIASYLNLKNISMVQVLEYDSLNSSNYFVKKTLTNKDTIIQLVDLLEKLPDEGDIMVKFAGTASFHKIILVESYSKYDTIDIVNNRIKTPKTSFYNPEREDEKEFIKLLIEEN